MIKINYKSDFEFVLKMQDCNGKPLPPPDYDFKGRLRSSGIRVFEFQCLGGVYENCFISDDKQLHIVCDSHGLNPGKLLCELECRYLDDKFPDGIRNQVTTIDTKIELISSQEVDNYNDECVNTTEVRLPVILEQLPAPEPEPVPEKKQLVIDPYLHRGVMPIDAHPGHIYKLQHNLGNGCEGPMVKCFFKQTASLPGMTVTMDMMFEPPKYPSMNRIKKLFAIDKGNWNIKYPMTAVPLGMPSKPGAIVYMLNVNLIPHVKTVYIILSDDEWEDHNLENYTYVMNDENMNRVYFNSPYKLKYREVEAPKGIIGTNDSNKAYVLRNLRFKIHRGYKINGKRTRKWVTKRYNPTIDNLLNYSYFLVKRRNKQGWSKFVKMCFLSRGKRLKILP